MTITSRGIFVGLAALFLNAFGAVAFATTPEELIQEYSAEAKNADKTFKGFSAENGKAFFHAERKNKKGESVSCTGCHTKDPTKSGKTRAGKVIEPMAIAVNKERFTDKAKVEKWFKRNCGDVYERACTPQEKGDFISFMKSVK